MSSRRWLGSALTSLHRSRRLGLCPHVTSGAAAQPGPRGFGSWAPDYPVPRHHDSPGEGYRHVSGAPFGVRSHRFDGHEDELRVVEGGDQVLEFDVCIVGAGPAGLAAAIRLKQLAAQVKRPISVCVVEKAAALGAHTISGAIMDPRGLNELLPGWQREVLGREAYGNMIPVTRDRLWFLTKRWKVALPVPPSLDNHGNVVGSLSGLVRWLGAKAEGLGVEIFTGFAGSRLKMTLNGVVSGVVTGEFGVARDGRKLEGFEEGVEFRAKATLLAEGCRGSLSQQAIARYGLRNINSAQPMTYALGIKEVWQLPDDENNVLREGEVVHTLGYPLSQRGTYGGGFVYRMGGNRISIGLIHTLDYRNPYQSPYHEWNRFKAHPRIREILEGAECVEYGARAINEGGVQSLPYLAFPGGALIGCAAGFVNVGRVKGIHTAIKSGTLAADVVYQEVVARPQIQRALGMSPGDDLSSSGDDGGESLATQLLHARSLSRASAPRDKGEPWISGGVMGPSLAMAEDGAGVPSTATSQGQHVRSGVRTPPGPPPPRGESASAGGGAATVGALQDTVPPKRHSPEAGERGLRWGAVFEQIPGASPFVDLAQYDRALRGSWVWDELWAHRNIRPAFSRFGWFAGMAWAAMDVFLFHGRVRFTFFHARRDYELDLAKHHQQIKYDPPDGRVTFDIPMSLRRSGAAHQRDQPVHLRLQVDRVFHASYNWNRYKGPEARYCPAGVFEYVGADVEPQTPDGGGSRPDLLRANYPQDLHREITRAMKREVEAHTGSVLYDPEGQGRGPSVRKMLVIHAHNCLHCKACDIKDPQQNIRWEPPEGGGGPNYMLM